MHLEKSFFNKTNLQRQNYYNVLKEYLLTSPEYFGSIFVCFVLDEHMGHCLQECKNKLVLNVTFLNQ